ncbi:unnamed protein product [Cyberlindnera jadinii]|uniref:Phosphotransferase n=1 Tax=Cyberlindnera jadinii (strain ATCC 18201 / CBS 1600 / BCRC 20928 / JCM 3617 / NBRC 0987 / NRRL Y-1542) TaxID=983966 RepID=A0A0H5C9H6_CYBJN|nr:unnamed protein product [Cyberlindnera jadinii]
MTVDSDTLVIKRVRASFESSKVAHLDGLILNQIERAYSCDSPISMLRMSGASVDITETRTQGRHLCIELGGSTLRIGIVEFHSDSGDFKMVAGKRWDIDESLKLVNDEFFEDIVMKCIEDIDFKAAGELPHSVCITWSFPLDPKGRIITMGKGWTLDKQLETSPLDSVFKAAFDKHGVRVDVKRVVNDSISLMMFALTKGSNMALVLGTGVNMCLARDSTLYNVELGFFGSLEQPTEYDLLLDERFSTMKEAFLTNDPARLFQPFEMLTSGRYLGELLRLVWISEPINLHCPFREPFSISGEQFCLLLNEPGVIGSIAHIILERAAYYVQSAIRALYLWATRHDLGKPFTIHYTGSFLHNCAEYQRLILEEFQELTLIHVETPMAGAAVGLFDYNHAHTHTRQNKFNQDIPLY